MSNEPAPRRRKLPPISFGPDALCFREGKDTFSIAYMALGTAVLDTRLDEAGIRHPARTAKMVTVHLLADGKIGVSVDDVPRMFVFPADDFGAFVRQYGQVVRVH